MVGLTAYTTYQIKTIHIMKEQPVLTDTQVNYLRAVLETLNNRSNDDALGWCADIIADILNDYTN